MKRILSLIFGLLSVSLYAQDVSSELVKINNFYGELTTYQTTVTKTYYQDVNSISGVGESMDVIISGSSSAYKTSTSALYVNKNYKMAVSLSEKTILVNALTHEDTMNLKKEAPTAQISRLVNTCGEKKVNKLSSKVNQIELTGCQSKYSVVKIEYDSKSYQIKKLELIGHRNSQGFTPKIVMSYSNFKANPKLSSQTFYGTEYVSYKNNEIKLTQTTQGQYELLDFRIK